MSDHFETSKEKLDQAEKYFAELQAKIEDFTYSNPYRQVIEAHPDKSGYEIHKIKLTEDISGSFKEFAALAGQIATALRSSLDNACYALAVATGKPANSKNCSFPFAPRVEDMPGSLGKSKDLPTQIHSLFCGFQPYLGGNDILWAVNEVANADKHRITTPVYNVIVQSGISAQGTRYVQIPYRHAWDSAKQEMVLLTLGPAADNVKFEYQFNFSISVAFDVVEPIKGKPVITVLNAMGRIVERVLIGIEAEAKRLKLI